MGSYRAAEGWQTRKAISTVPVAQAIVVLSAGRVQPPGAPDVSEWGDADRFYGGVQFPPGFFSTLLRHYKLSFVERPYVVYEPIVRPNSREP